MKRRRIPKLPPPVVSRADSSVRYTVMGCWGDETRGDSMADPVYPPYYVLREVNEAWPPGNGLPLDQWNADEDNPEGHKSYRTQAAALRAARRLAGGTRGHGARPAMRGTAAIPPMSKRSWRLPSERRAESQRTGVHHMGDYGLEADREEWAAQAASWPGLLFLVAGEYTLEETQPDFVIVYKYKDPAIYEGKAARRLKFEAHALEGRALEKFLAAAWKAAARPPEPLPQRGRGAAHPQPPFVSVLGEDTRYIVVPSGNGFGVRRQYIEHGTWETDPDWYDTDQIDDDYRHEEPRERTYRAFREAARAAWRHAHLVEGYEG